MDIYQALLAAKKGSRNGIWAYILANTFAPVALQNQFDMVLGNPPWLTFRDIVANDYQNEVRAIARKTGCMPGKETLITHLELASVFVSWSLSYFLRKDGRLAFVMPRSILINKMREGRVGHLRLRSLWDLQDISPLFRVPACVLFCEKGKISEPVQDAIQGKRLSGSLAASSADPDSAKLDETDACFRLSWLNQRSAWSEEDINFREPSPYIGRFSAGPTLFP